LFDNLADKQTDKQTDTPENITSFFGGDSYNIMLFCVSDVSYIAYYRNIAE